jgi:hypothetical protein
MPTREEYIEAGKKAVAAKDYKSANEIAAAISKMDAENAPPDAPVVTQEEPQTYIGGVKKRFGESDFVTPVTEGLQDLSRRADVTRSPEMGGMEGQNTLSRNIGLGASQLGRTGGELLMEAGGVLVPEVVKEAAGDAWEVLKQSPYAMALAKAAGWSMEEYQKVAEENPRAAEEFETLVDVGTLFSPRPDLLNLDKKVRDAKAAGYKDSQRKEKIALTGLMEPEGVARTARIKTEKQGLLGTETWIPDEFDDELIDGLLTIPGINPYGSYHDFFRTLQDHVEGQRTKLDNLVETQNKKVDLDDLNSELEFAIEDFMNSDIYGMASGPAQEVFQRYVEQAVKILKSEGNDVKGVLNARRRFDKALHESGQSLEPDVSNYQSQAARLVRNVFNDYLKRNTSGDDVHNLLDQQHKALTALDRTVNRRNKEARTAPSRLVQNIQENTGIVLGSSALTVLATLSAVSGNPLLGAGLGAAAGATLISKQIYRHGKREVLRGYAELLSATDKAIKTINDPLKLEAMELDRMVIVDMINEVRNYEEPNEDG